MQRTQPWSTCKDSRKSPEANGSHSGPAISSNTGRRRPGPLPAQDTFPFQAPMDKPLLLTICPLGLMKGHGDLRCERQNVENALWKPKSFLGGEKHTVSNKEVGM